MKKAVLVCCILLAAVLMIAVAEQGPAPKLVTPSEPQAPTIMATDVAPAPAEITGDDAVRQESKMRYYELMQQLERGTATTGEKNEIRMLCSTWNFPLPTVLVEEEDAGRGSNNGNLDQGSSDTLSNCASATVISSCPFNDSGVFDGDNDCSTIAISPSNEVFYQFTPAVSGFYQLRARSQSGGVAAIRVVSGGCCAGAVAVGFSSTTVSSTDCYRPDSARFEPSSQVTYLRVSLVAGTPYWIHVGTSSTTVSTAAYQFNLWCVPCPTNGDPANGVNATCATATAFTLGDSLLGDSANSSGATRLDWFTFTKTTGYDTVLFYVGGRAWGHCVSGLYPSGTGPDGRFTLFKDNGTGCPGDSIFYDDDGTHGDTTCSFDAAGRLCVGPGTYYLKVWNYNDADYILKSTILGACPPPVDCAQFGPCGTPAEIEPNNACANSANFITLNCVPGQTQNFYGTICPQADVDYFAIGGFPAGEAIQIRLFQGPNCDQPTGGVVMQGATGTGGACAAATGTATFGYLIGSPCAATAPGYFGVLRSTGAEQRYRIEVQCLPLPPPACPDVQLAKQYCSGPCDGLIHDSPVVSDFPQTVAGLNEIIDDLNVRVNLTHTFDADIDMFLITPQGDSIELTTDNGSSGDNFSVTLFDDEATTLVTAGVAPYNGSFKPEGLLSLVDGRNTDGNWILRIRDDATSDSGYVYCWCLEFTSHAPCQATPVVELTRFPIPQYACINVCPNSTTLLRICQAAGFDPTKTPIVTVSSGCASDTRCNVECSPGQIGYSPTAWQINPANGCWENTVFGGTVGCACVCLEGFLDVQLNSFAAVSGDHSVTLNWATASEPNNDRFEINRDGVKVAELDARGSNSSGAEYSWTDNGLVNGTNYEYSLIAVDVNGNRGTLATQSATPVSGAPVITEYALHQNYPNPFNPTTTITFDLVEAGNVTLKVYNLMGQEIATLVNSQLAAGRHLVTFDATNLPSGLYLYRIEANGFADQHKMLLMK